MFAVSAFRFPQAYFLVSMWLKAKAFQILQSELQPNEMFAIYAMTKGKELPKSVTRMDLTNIIEVLCKKLGWFEDDQVNENSTKKRASRASALRADGVPVRVDF